MLGAYLYGPRDLRLLDGPADTVGPGEVRIAISYTGICGTDLHLYGGMIFGAAMTQPRPLGHEYAGHIVEVGPAVTGLRVGQRVTAMPSGPCGRCLLCRTGRPAVCQHRYRARTGAWAPAIVAPAEFVYPLPDAVSDRLAAMTEPLACAVRAVDRAGLRSADRVCIIGGGPIGLMLLKLAQASGASLTIISEPSPYRRALAERLGADRVVDPTTAPLAAAVAELTDGLGADVVFEAVGLPATIEQALTAAAPGGRVVIVGVTDRDAEAGFRPQEIFWKELMIIGSREWTNGADRALRWLSRLDLEPIITHTFPLAEAQAAIDLALTGQAGKILLQPAA
jgi:2-desacetyl-2-hydroxyethyl bacteriochlorophyllide A dehydrogenase